jgi:hypothetical protein
MSLINNQVLAKLKSKQELVSIYRELIDDDPIEGFILDFSEKFMLIHYEYEFFLDGFRILRNSDITNAKVGSTNSFHRKLMKADNQLKELQIPFKINLENIKNTIQAISANRSLFVIEIEKEDTEQFLFGNVDKIVRNKVHFKHMDGTGTWLKDTIVIDSDEITMIQFDSNYLKKYEKHVMEKERKAKR